MPRIGRRVAPPACECGGIQEASLGAFLFDLVDGESHLGCHVNRAGGRKRQIRAEYARVRLARSRRLAQPQPLPTSGPACVGWSAELALIARVELLVADPVGRHNDTSRTYAEGTSKRSQIARNPIVKRSQAAIVGAPAGTVTTLCFAQGFVAGSQVKHETRELGAHTYVDCG